MPAPSSDHPPPAANRDQPRGETGPTATPEFREGGSEASGAGALLLSYFRTGWAFLIPYLAIYLLYAWQRWPVNPAVSGQQSTVSSQISWVPCLLHVYWFLHALNLVLGLVALMAWLRNSRRSEGTMQLDAGSTQEITEGNGGRRFSLRRQASVGTPTPTLPHESDSTLKPQLSSPDPQSPPFNPQPSTFNSQPSAFRSVLWPLLPWVMLGLLFLIPGNYLEFPADPWEHLRRINSWESINEVREYSYWAKSGYFLAYSLVGWVTPNSWQLFLCDVYLAGVSLLLCRQYYALARAMGLPDQPALLFTALQALLLGNNIFSFYRYYGLASTMFAQIAAIALVCRVIQACRSLLPATDPAQPKPPGWLTPGLVMSIAALTALMAFNHVQALGIAALGVVAAAIHTAVAIRRSVIWWLAGAVLAGSLFVVYVWPGTAHLDHAGLGAWFNRWHGLDLFSPRSPAFLRTLQILGVFGVVNLVVGVALVLRNQLAGWLTILPCAALGLPLAAIPFADLVTRADPNNIVVFHRMFLAVPAGLAVVAGAGLVLGHLRRINWPHTQRVAFGALVLGLGFLTVAPPQGPYFNRFWNLVAQAPADLSMRPVWDGFQRGVPPLRGRESLYASGSRISFVLETLKPVPTVYAPYFYRGYTNDGNLPGMEFKFIDRVLANAGARSGSVVIVADPTLMYSPYSFAGLCSGHWLAREVSLAYAGAAELRTRAEEAGLRARPPEGGISYFVTPTKK